MKDLKIGDLVYHKKHGRGIVKAVIGVIDLSVHFQDRSLTIDRMDRKELFVKGDKVYNLSWNGGRKWDNDVYTFYDAVTHNPKSKSKFTVLRPNGKIVYCIDVQHVNTIYHVPTQSTFEYEYSKYEEFKQSLIEIEKKESMVLSLKLMELEATAKSMLATIKELK